MICHVYKLKKKTHMFIPVNTEKAFDTVQHPHKGNKQTLLIKLGGEDFFNLTKVIYKHLTADTIFHV